MAVRMATVAGQFYESSPSACREQIESLLPRKPLEAELPQRILAGIVPHAGWVFSGDLAALVFAAIKENRPVDTFVIFGAVHSVRADCGLLYDNGQWGTPLGVIDVDEPLAEAILAKGPDLIKADTSSHSREHSIEVQVPIIQHLFPDAAIVPLMVPPFARAHEIGQVVADVIKDTDKHVVCVASTDLTHYGPSYGFTPMGTGTEGVDWAKCENDSFFINLTLSMQSDKLVDSARMYGSACGSGAVAAAAAAAKNLDAKKGYLLDHTTSAEIVQKKYHQQSSDSVGYAAIVFG